MTEISSTMRAYADRLIVEDPPHQEMSSGGIVWVGGQKLDVVASTVRSIGPLVKDKGLKVGDRVLHTRLTGVKYEGPTYGARRGNYRIILEKELLAVLSPEAVFDGGTGYFDADGLHETARS